MSFTWKIVPLCDEDFCNVSLMYILNKGRYFSQSDNYISDLAFGAHLISSPSRIFVVKTHDNEEYYESIRTEGLIADFQHSGDKIFYLGGNRPEKYLDHWEELLCNMSDGAFVTDFYCTDFKYDVRQLACIDKHARGIFRVCLSERTCSTDSQYFWDNVDILVDSGLRLIFQFLDKDKLSQDRVTARIIRRYPWLAGYFKQFSR